MFFFLVPECDQRNSANLAKACDKVTRIGIRGLSQASIGTISFSTSRNIRSRATLRDD